LNAKHKAEANKAHEPVKAEPAKVEAKGTTKGKAPEKTTKHVEVKKDVKAPTKTTVAPTKTAPPSKPAEQPKKVEEPKKSSAPSGKTGKK